MVGAVRAAHVHAELGGHHELVAPALQRLAEHLLAGAGRVAVDVGGVEQRDPGVGAAGHVVAAGAAYTKAANPKHAAVMGSAGTSERCRAAISGAIA